MFTKRNVAVLSYIGAATIASIFLTGSFCNKEECIVGGINYGQRSSNECQTIILTMENSARAKVAADTAAAKAAEEAAKNPVVTPMESGMGGGMMEGGMMEGGMMQGGMEGGMQAP